MENRNKFISLMVVLILGVLRGGVLGEEKAKLRWEYKYREGETLMYSMKGKDITRNAMFGGYDREVVGVLGIEVGGKKNEDWQKARTWTKVERINDEKEMYQKSSAYGESMSGEIEINRDGTVETLTYGNVFFLGLPRFSESGLDFWNKPVELNEKLGPYKGVRIKVTGYYAKLVGEETIKGRNCVIISTEIGGKTQGTEAERGEFMRSDNRGKMRIQVTAKSWFSSEEGRVIKMESELKLFDDSEYDAYEFAKYIKKIAEENKEIFKNTDSAENIKILDEAMKEMEKTGDKRKKLYGDIEDVNRHFTYELLSELEIKHLDGIEDNWELVLPGVNNFQLTKDGKIVFVREEIKVDSSQMTDDSKEKAKNEDPSNLEPRTSNQKTTYIYICDGDGNNQRRLTEGSNPVVSPDGKMIAYGKNGNELWVVGTESREQRAESREQRDSI
ncbi:MAG: hypothetical protein AB1414_15415 [bacterium]